MRDFGPKRPVSEDTVKAKRGRPKKKPNYDKDKMIQDQLEKAVALFVEPYDDREKRSDDAPSLSEVARQLGTTTIRARKMLITAGYYTTKASRRIQELHDSGANMQEIIAATGMKEASIYCYLPYSKGVYNLADPTLCAEQNRLFRKRKAACVTLGEHLDDPESEKFLWETLEAFETYLF